MEQVSPQLLQNATSVLFLPIFLQAIRDNSTIKFHHSDDNGCEDFNYDAIVFGFGIAINGKLCQKKSGKSGNTNPEDWSVDVTVAVQLAGMNVLSTQIHLDDKDQKVCRTLTIGLASLELCLAVEDSSLVLSGQACGFGNCDDFSETLFSWKLTRTFDIIEYPIKPSYPLNKIYHSEVECERGCKSECLQHRYYCSGQGKKWYCHCK